MSDECNCSHCKTWRAKYDAAADLLRLFIEDRVFDPNCAHAGGKPCYTCRAFTLLDSALGEGLEGKVPKSESQSVMARRQTGRGE